MYSKIDNHRIIYHFNSTEFFIETLTDQWSKARYEENWGERREERGGKWGQGTGER